MGFVVQASANDSGKYSVSPAMGSIAPGWFSSVSISLLPPALPSSIAQDKWRIMTVILEKGQDMREEYLLHTDVHKY